MRHLGSYCMLALSSSLACNRDLPTEAESASDGADQSCEVECCPSGAPVLDWCLHVERQSYRTAMSLLHLASGNFDGDSHADVLAVGTNATGAVVAELRRGDGSGRLGVPFDPLVRGCSAYPVHADLNEDAILDLVQTTCGPSVLVQWGTSSGQFKHATEHELPFAIMHSTAVVQLDDRGPLDLIVLGKQDGVVMLTSVLGRSDRTFETIAVVNVPQHVIVPTGLVVAHFDSDGFYDAALLRAGDGGAIAVAYGRQNGEFDEPLEIRLELAPQGLVATQLDGDGISDLVTISGNPPRMVGLLATNARSTWSELQRSLGIAAPVSFVARDLDDDGIDELLTMTGDVHEVSVWQAIDMEWQRVDATLATSPHGVILLTSDLNDDDVPDLIVGYPTMNSFELRLSLPRPETL